MQLKVASQLEEVAVAELTARVRAQTVPRNALVQSPQEFGDARWRELSTTVLWQENAPLWDSASCPKRLAFLPLLLAVCGSGLGIAVMRHIAVVDQLNMASYEIGTHSALSNVATIAGLALMLVGGIAWTYMLHTMWLALKGPFARMTPRSAVVCTFIPLHHWWWEPLTGFGQDYNALATAIETRHGQHLARVHTRLYRDFVIWTIVPVVVATVAPRALGVLTLVPVLFAGFVIAVTCGVVNRLVSAREAVQGSLEVPEKLTNG